MATPTYIPLATTTLASATGSVTFTSIPASYRDLILVVNFDLSANGNAIIRFNSDSGRNYSHVIMRGFSSGYGSATGTETGFYLTWSAHTAGTRAMATVQVQDFSATDKHKISLSRTNARGADYTEATACRWANTDAITTVQVFSDSTYTVGSTFSLFGIEA